MIQRTNSQMKSYANILSEGLIKVKNVFKQKSKEESSSSSDKDNSKKSLEQLPKIEATPVIIEQRPVEQTVNFRCKTDNEHPEIPGLLFKADLERRNSKKKRKSKVIEMNVDNIEKKEVEDKSFVKDSAVDQNIQTISDK